MSLVLKKSTSGCLDMLSLQNPYKYAILKTKQYIMVQSKEDGECAMLRQQIFGK